MHYLPPITLTMARFITIVVHAVHELKRSFPTLARIGQCQIYLTSYTQASSILIHYLRPTLDPL